MRNAFSAFEAELAKLRSFIIASQAEEALYIAIDQVISLFDDDLQTTFQKVQNNRTDTKRYRYFLSVIIQYGALERFVEESAHAYARVMVAFSQNYKDLPEKMRETHLKNSIEYLKQSADPRFKTDDTSAQIAGRLSACLDNKDNYALNLKALTIKSGNMTIDRINAIMRSISIEFSVEKVAGTSEYKKRHLELYESPVDLTEAAQGRLFSKIDALVVLRNRIAHGVINTDDIEDAEIILERIQDLKNFGAGLDALLVESALTHFVSRGIAQEIGRLVAVYSHCIVCVEMKDGDIAVNDVVVMAPNDHTEPVRHGRVLSIEVDHVSKEVVHGGPGLKVGFKVDFRASDKATYYKVDGPFVTVMQL